MWYPAWVALRHPGTPIGRLLWIYGVGMLAFASMTSIMALYLGAEFGFNETTIGYVFLYVGILSFVMRSALLGPIVDRIGEIWAMRIGTGLLVLGLVLYPVPRDLWTLALVIPLVPIGTALLFPATTSLMSRVADPKELGTTMGVAQTFAGLARVGAPLLATALFQRLGHGWPFFVAGGFVGLVGIMAFQVDVHRRAANRAAEGAGA
jgi:MFS family permease